MLKAENITVVRKTRKLLDRVTITVEPGRVTALVGPNGAGKSTLLRVLAGEIRPSSGVVMLDSQDLSSLSPSHLASRRAVVPQSATLSFPFTALEVVMLAASVPGFGAGDDRAVIAATSALHCVGLAGYEHRFCAELSGGERQRVHVARALCQLSVSPAAAVHPLALLLDEPTANLDIAHQVLVLDQAQRQARRGRAVLIVLHDLNMAAAYADHIVLLSAGIVAASGCPPAVLTEERLSSVFGCEIEVRRSAHGVTVILPAKTHSDPSTAKKAKHIVDFLNTH